MKEIFYVLLIIPLHWELYYIISPSEMQSVWLGVKNKHPKQFNPQERFAAFHMVFYIVLRLLGLFTINWPLFVLSLILGPYTKEKRGTAFVMAFIRLLILIFCFVNEFSLKIPVFKEIKGFLFN